MQDRTVPRPPKLPELAKLQALLLLGGAFVFASLACVALRYDLVADRTPAAPEGSVLAATIFDRQSEDWLAFEAKLPEKARQALSNAGELESVTLFAVPGAGLDLDWGLLEALSVVTERTGHKRIRLVPKGTSAAGYVVLGDRSVPFQASVTRGLIKARVGLDFRGLSLASDPFDKGRRHLAPIYLQSSYLEKPSGASWNRVTGLLSAQLQRFQPQAGLWNLPGRMEMAVSASETEGLSPFVLYYRPEFGSNMSGPALETYAKALLAESDPIGFDVALPDDTRMIELRRDPDSILTQRKTLNQFGERAQLGAPGSSQTIEIFYSDDGEVWMSTDIGLIQGSIMGNVGAQPPHWSCEEGGKDGFAAFSGKSLESWPFFSNMDRLTFSIHNIQSGMFTTCGYFTP